MRDKFVTLARSFLGASEYDGSHREIIDIYNRIRPLPQGYRMGYNEPWCAAFVSAVGELGGMGSVILPECACERMTELYKSRGRFSRSEPAELRPGDIVMYDWGSDGIADHVGIIEEAGEKLKVIEGNLSNSVGYRMLERGSKNIRGYCLPAFEETRHCDSPSCHCEGEARGNPSSPCHSDIPPCHSERSEESHQTTSLPHNDLRLPTLSRGSTGEPVRAAQLLLIGRGSRCGPWGADSEFGDGTYGAVLRYQQLHKLQSDGIVGMETWRSLLGL